MQLIKLFENYTYVNLQYLSLREYSVEYWYTGRQIFALHQTLKMVTCKMKSGTSAGTLILVAFLSLGLTLILTEWLNSSQTRVITDVVIHVYLIILITISILAMTLMITVGE